MTLKYRLLVFVLLGPTLSFAVMAVEVAQNPGRMAIRVTAAKQAAMAMMGSVRS